MIRKLGAFAGHIENLPAESEEGRFVLRDIHTALLDAQVSFENGDSAHGTALLKELNRDRGGALGFDFPPDTHEIPPSETEAVRQDQQKWLKKIRETVPDMKGGEGIIRRTRKLLGTVGAGAAPFYWRRPCPLRKKRGGTGLRGGKPSALKVPGEILNRFENVSLGGCFDVPVWNALDTATQIQVLRESMESIPFDKNENNTGIKLHSFFEENAHNTSVRNFAEEIAEKHPEVILTGNVSWLAHVFGGKETAIRLIRTAIMNTPEEIVAEKFSNPYSILYELEYYAEIDDILPESVRTLIRKYQPLRHIVRRNLEPMLGGMTWDPALRTFIAIPSDWVPEEQVSNPDEAGITEHRLMIARNMWFRNMTDNPSPEAVAEEGERILRAREAVRDMPLFTGRNVIMIAGNEEKTDKYIDSDEYRYGTEKTVEEVKQQQGEGYSFERFRPVKGDRTTGNIAGNKGRGAVTHS